MNKELYNIAAGIYNEPKSNKEDDMGLMVSGLMCYPMHSKMCPFMSGGDTDMVTCLGIKIFLLVWVVFVPIVITARLEKIIKLLQEKK